jgi:Protein of unknown function (DUF3093)
VPSSPVYDERLSVPLRWWLLAALFLASVLVAFLVSTPLWVTVTVTAVLAAAVTAVFLGYGAARVRVREGVLTAGRARIGLEHLGPARVLDARAARLAAGRDADARAYLLIRPYLHRAVQVEVVDPRDPTPYWLVATRRPDRLAASLAAAAEAPGSVPPVQPG